MIKKINEVMIYITSIIFCLHLTKITENQVFDMISLIVVIVPFFLLFYELKSYFCKEYLKKNIFILLYIVLRIISIFFISDKIQNLKILAYEAYFFLVIYNLFIKENKIRKNTMILIISSNVIINIITVFLWPGEFNFEKMIYTNPNAMGNFTCICLIVYIAYFYKQNKKSISVLYIIFSLVIIWMSSSRTPIIVIVFFALSQVIVRFNIISEKNVKRLSIWMIILINIIIILFSYYNRDNMKPSNIEETVNNYTTNRYYLWKYSIISLDESPILGIGGANIGIKRFEKVPDKMLQYIEQHRSEMLSKNNNHSGYIQLLVSNGYLLFVILIIWLYKIKEKTSIENTYIIDSILILNLFENLLITSPNIFAFIMMYLLSQQTEMLNKEN